MRIRLLALLLALAVLLSGCVVIYVDVPGESIYLSGEGMAVHFIDVGQADCALLICDGEAMLIDGGNVEDSRKVVTYLERQGVEELSAVVCTHAHEDHAGGLPAVLAVYPTGAVYAPTKTYSSKVFDDFTRYTDQQGLEITIPEPGETFFLGEAAVMVLGPVKDYAETNNTSLVLRVDYGEDSFLFTGDMELTAENDMLDYWGQTDLFRADVLKVGHHGSDTSTGYRFLHEISPVYGVISVGAKNSYGHPHEQPLSRLYQAGMTVLRTDELGTVVAHTDGSGISFTWENQSAEPQNAEPAQPVFYVGNKDSRRFHAADCDNLPKAANRVIFVDYEEAVSAGYTPCRSCLE